MTVLLAGPPLIAAVVVTYQPDVELVKNLRQLLVQVPLVIVVDNGSTGSSVKVVAAAGELAGVQLIRNESNLGIATALNFGIRQALLAGYQWVATFDQDSSIPECFFTELFRAYYACPAPERTGMIVPGKWLAPVSFRAEPASAQDALFTFVAAAMTSGSLIKAEMFETVGFYDDALFIDYVDADYCLRLRKKGFKILSATSVILAHELGTKQTRNLLGYSLCFRIHVAWRYYYIVRNRLVLYRRYFTTFPRWALRDARWLMLELGRIIFLEKGRRQKLFAVFQGFRDGLRGKTGRHPDFP
ncbi:MAG: glycosyltransferase family 2 protein [Verrucomicrobiota bacterium]